jgi:dihydrofolate reductase
MGHPILMGRKTWESIGRALPGRISIVITRQRGYAAPGAEVVHSLADGLTLARTHEDQETFIIGGAEIFSAALPYADRIYLTRVHTHIKDADVFFPLLEIDRWKLVEEIRLPADERNDYATTFQILDRIPD